MGLTSLEPEIIHGMKFPFRGGDRIMCLGDLQPGCVEPDAAMAPLHDRMRVKTREKSISPSRGRVLRAMDPNQDGH